MENQARLDLRGELQVQHGPHISLPFLQNPNVRWIFCGERRATLQILSKTFQERQFWDEKLAVPMGQLNRENI